MTEDIVFRFYHDPEPVMDYGSYPRQYLLQMGGLPPEISLAVGNPMGRDQNGEIIKADTSDLRFYGNSYISSYGQGLEWKGQLEYRKVRFDRFFHSFGTLILTSQKIKEVIEEEDIPNIEFIPMRVFYKQSDEFIADMWIINVFNWKDVFDYEQSDLVFNQYPFDQSAMDRISARFGDKRIINWNYLKVNIDETRDGLFLAKGPSINIWERPFISKPLADKIMAAVNPSLPKRGKLAFYPFSLNRLRDRECPIYERPSDYHYAGWTGEPAGVGQ